MIHPIVTINFWASSTIMIHQSSPIFHPSSTQLSPPMIHQIHPTTKIHQSFIHSSIHPSSAHPPGTAWSSLCSSRRRAFRPARLARDGPCVGHTADGAPCGEDGDGHQLETRRGATSRGRFGRSSFHCRGGGWFEPRIFSGLTWFTR